MNPKLPAIYFYISHFDWLCQNMPESADIYLPHLSKQGIVDGEYCWILQTYLRLRDDGFPCQLTGTMPDEGIVLVHRNTLPFNFQPGPRLLIVCLKADKPARPYAQIHLVQNSYETKILRNSYSMLHWPQPGLIPREPSRGDKFETVAFCGTGGNLAPELLDPSWREELKALGLQWCFKNRWQWNDFSNVDVILAVRSFGSTNSGVWKPPTKLYNAWHAGVPAILAPEPAFRDLRRSDLDYLEVSSLDETIAALKRLRDDKELRQAMIENGHIRAEETKPEKLVAMWRSFLIDVAVPAYESWCNTSSISKQVWLTRKYFGIKLNGLRGRLQSLFNIPKSLR
ncbi:MAG: glycosyltransferase family 1 protein [Moorea sp. SIO2B7]|nr:glycosyltransferase family 1 protein [Moorena sp. SIO2B7]